MRNEKIDFSQVIKLISALGSHHVFLVWNCSISVGTHENFPPNYDWRNTRWKTHVSYKNYVYSYTCIVHIECSYMHFSCRSCGTRKAIIDKEYTKKHTMNIKFYPLKQRTKKCRMCQRMQMYVQHHSLWISQIYPLKIEVGPLLL